MQFNEIVEVLKNSPLDQETKLSIIDLITLNDDEKFTASVSALILEWKNADGLAVAELQNDLHALSEEHALGTQALERQQRTAGIEIVDAIKSEERMVEIKEQLSKDV